MARKDSASRFCFPAFLSLSLNIGPGSPKCNCHTRQVIFGKSLKYQPPLGFYDSTAAVLSALPAVVDSNQFRLDNAKR
jgi:hypothetical protein